ncbi:hypothetical protein CYMTET_36435 [Cymbomonas tetramitiformis]|uniref:Uncharacterized protein n=1 Tax=Cymbomonas tetramitiformis TaxID=36881 RepID=A0AAE0F7U5_9CHLO|nr:hypothetical protein CYMTET_36435 [Cymbomonas tetramitiformis]
MMSLSTTRTVANPQQLWPSAQGNQRALAICPPGRRRVSGSRQQHSLTLCALSSQDPNSWGVKAADFSLPLLLATNPAMAETGDGSTLYIIGPEITLFLVSLGAVIYQNIQRKEKKKLKEEAVQQQEEGNK